MNLKKITRTLWYSLKSILVGITLLFSIIWFMGVGLATTLVLTGVEITTPTFIIGEYVLKATGVIPILIILLVGIEYIEETKKFKKLDLIKNDEV